ncbi:hypothetical protein DSECCO2_92960 [anaerobic digester metagenome]
MNKDNIEKFGKKKELEKEPNMDQNVNTNHLTKIQIIIAILIPLTGAMIVFISDHNSQWQFERSNQPNFEFNENINNNSNIGSNYRNIQIIYDDKPFTIVNSSAQFYLVLDVFPNKKNQKYKLNPKYTRKNEYATIYIPIDGFYGINYHRYIPTRIIAYCPLSRLGPNGTWISNPVNQDVSNITSIISSFMKDNKIEGCIHTIKTVDINYIDMFNKPHQKYYYSYTFNEFFEIQNLDFINSRRIEPISFQRNSYQNRTIMSKIIYENIFKNLMSSYDTNTGSNNITQKEINCFENNEIDNIQEFSTIYFNNLVNKDELDFLLNIGKYYLNDKEIPSYSSNYYKKLQKVVSNLREYNDYNFSYLPD